MAGFVHSSKTRAILDTFALAAYVREGGEEYTGDVEDVTVWADTARGYHPGSSDGSVSLNGLFDSTTGAVHDAFKPLAGLQSPVPYLFAPEGLAVGSVVWLANLLRMTYGLPASVPGMVQVSMSGQATGGVDHGVSLADLSARTTTADGTAHDSGASSADGGVAHLHVTEASAADTLDVKVQHSVDAGGPWVDLVTFTQVTAAEAQRIEVTGTVNQHLRATWTIGGTTPEFTFAVAFARR